MATEAVRAWATNRGFVMARHVFKKRGNQSEAHIGLQELSALMTAALEIGAEHALDFAEKCAEANMETRMGALLDTVERPAPIPEGAPGSLMRRAWDIGTESARKFRSSTSLAYRTAAEVVANCFPTSDAVGRLRSMAEDWKRTDV